MDHIGHLYCYIFQRIWSVDSKCYQDNVCFRIGERAEALFMFITKMDRVRSSISVFTSYSSWPLRFTVVELPFLEFPKKLLTQCPTVLVVPACRPIGSRQRSSQILLR